MQRCTTLSFKQRHVRCHHAEWQRGDNATTRHCHRPSQAKHAHAQHGQPRSTPGNASTYLLGSVAHDAAEEGLLEVRDDLARADHHPSERHHLVDVLRVEVSKRLHFPQVVRPHLRREKRERRQVVDGVAGTTRRQSGGSARPQNVSINTAQTPITIWGVICCPPGLNLYLEGSHPFAGRCRRALLATVMARGGLESGRNYLSFCNTEHSRLCRMLNDQQPFTTNTKRCASEIGKQTLSVTATPQRAKTAESRSTTYDEEAEIAKAPHQDAWEQHDCHRFLATVLYLYAARSHELLLRVHPRELFIHREVHDRHDFLEGTKCKTGRSDRSRQGMKEDAAKHYYPGCWVRLYISHSASRVASWAYEIPLARHTRYCYEQPNRCTCLSLVPTRREGGCNRCWPPVSSNLPTYQTRQQLIANSRGPLTSLTTCKLR